MKFILLYASLLFCSYSLFSKEFSAKNNNDIRSLASSLKAGDMLIIKKGKYAGGISLNNLKGTKESPITISGEGIDETIFENGKQAFHLINCHYIILKNFTVKNFSQNGVNADDGGSQEAPSSGVIFENLSIIEIGPKGNLDGLKLSGLHNFTVKNCFFSGWGGSAIDMVGCHNGQILNCTLKGISGYSQATGIQMKGGTSGMKVLGNIFTNAGQRAINLGGSTGVKWFRPLGAKYEAKDIEVAGNTFIGGMAHIAFVTSTNSLVHHNTFYKPDKWFFRILQETKDPLFIKTQKGQIRNNIFVFDNKVRSFINIGNGTLPETFSFSLNVWEDSEGKRKPALPVKETGGMYNSGVKLKQKENGTFEADAKFSKYGASSFKIKK